MVQNTETSQRSGTAAAKQSGSPGLPLFAVVAILVGSAFWLWLTMADSALPQANTDGQLIGSELAQVGDQEIADALTTMGGLPKFLDRFRQKDTGCPLPLAWVSIAKPPGQSSGTIRLRSGGYLSPVFNLSETPVRVAIPFPSPYEMGKGQLMVLGTEATATISLVPPWPVSFRQGNIAAHNVYWRPIKQCSDANG
ncbi:hypothetical protein FHT86_007653 [Rhizobium sp. BK313]|uniref:hypothetical protein n=1 Tax=Rhizobium sp. BK313 TaxID=2587081 RepID=UPI001060D932|nr:hypothetical protein [Rhizobium sp. BK313]MBB3459321.1 hypothetical protein [Rhizobium sp. BK313]